MAPRVLLIDDLDDDREMYGEGLRAHGLEVVLSDSANGIAAATKNRPAVIVLHLAFGDHWELCESLRRACADIPVIVLTAAVRPDGGNRQRARSSVNCAAFVGKPCTPEELALVIARVTAGERRIELTSGYRSHAG